MLALVLDGDAHLEQRPEPALVPGEVLVAGVCDTDLQLARGYMGFRGVPGNEMVGTVIQEGDATRVGKRVVADINASCGACDDCTLRDGHHCPTRTVLGIAGRSGAFAERLVVPERCLVEAPDALADDSPSSRSRSRPRCTCLTTRPGSTRAIACSSSAAASSAS